MGYGYKILNNAGVTTIDTDTGVLPLQTYPGIETVVTDLTVVVYDLLGIGTSSVNFHIAARRFPSGTAKREMLFTNPLIGDQVPLPVFVTNLPTQLDMTTTFTITNPAALTIAADVAGWPGDVSHPDFLILIPVLI